MKRVTTNLNYNIWVTLDEKGLEILKQKGRDPAWYEEKGWYKFQMWQFMEIFGQTMMGCYAPFSMRVELEIDD